MVSIISMRKKIADNNLCHIILKNTDGPTSSLIPGHLVITNL